MTFRGRLTLAFGVIALVPLLVFGYGVRREMTSQLDPDAAGRVAKVRGAVSTQVSRALAADRTLLQSLAADLAADNRFRFATADYNSTERRWLIDWAANAMRLSGLAVLQLQDSTGRILSSGQFRNDFDRLDPGLPAALGMAPDRSALVSVRTAEAPVRALVSLDSFSVGGRPFTLVGGHALDSAGVAALSRDGEIGVVLVIGDSTPPADTVGSVPLPYFDDRPDHALRPAHLMLVRDLAPERALRRSVNRWLLVTLGGTLAAAILVGILLAGRVSKPIADLAEKTSTLDLDRLDQDFSTDRTDEIGALSRLLGAMAHRLRTGAARLRDAERAAATGELARQINHDIKNGLAPIRNVLRHLTQVAEQAPDTLASVYLERRPTLDSSVEYLDELARNYARLTPSLGRASSDAGAVLHEVARGVHAAEARVDVRLPESLPPVKADAVVLRRIIENLVSNAVDALDGKPGTVTLAGQCVGEGLERRVRFTVADTGRGMTRPQLDRAFDDFYTTKPSGTGLGLSVVRRLLTDLGGSIRVETAPGEGSTFTVELPAG